MNNKYFLIFTILLLFSLVNAIPPTLTAPPRTVFDTSVNYNNYTIVNGSAYNSTYDNILNQQCPTDYYVYRIQANGTVLCREDQTGGLGGNSSWNETRANSLYYSVSNPNGYYNITTLPVSGSGNISGDGINSSMCVFTGNNTISNSEITISSNTVTNPYDNEFSNGYIAIRNGVLYIGTINPTTYENTYISDPNQFGLFANELNFGNLGTTDERLDLHSHENNTIEVSSPTNVNLVELVGFNVSVNDTFFAKNICYSNGSNCQLSAGSSYNVTYDSTTNDVNANRSAWFSTYNVSYHGSLNNASYLSTYNSTYDSFAYNQTVAITSSDGNLSVTGGVLSRILTLNFTSIKNYFDTLYQPIGNYLGVSDLPLENRTKIAYQNITNIPTCSGTDKLTYSGGVLSCDTDETGSGSSTIAYGYAGSANQGITTNSSNGGEKITGMNFSIGANEVWSGQAEMGVVASGAGAEFSMMFSIPQNASIIAISSGSGGSNVKGIVANGTWMTNLITGGGQAWLSYTFHIRNGATAGQVIVYGAPRASGTATVYGNQSQWSFTKIA